jgi:hypothetical protein
MLVRTLRPCEVAGRTVRAGMPLDLRPEEAAAMIEAGDAEAIESTADGVEFPTPPPAEQE